MKRKLILYLISCFLISLWPVLCPGEIIQGETIKAGIIQGKATNEEGKNWGIALGLRSTYYRMQQNSGKIFRNINLLDEEQNFVPYKPLIQINFFKYWSLELAYDQFKAATLNRAFDIYPEHDKRWTDGFVEWAPIMLALEFRWPHFHKSFIPYILGGISYTKTSWKRNDWYYYGFPSLEEYNNWTRQGRNPEDYSSTGYRRIFAVDDHCIGTLLGLGVDYFIYKNLALNLDWRYHWATVNFTYTLAANGGRDPFSCEQGTFVLDSWILGIGVKYFF
ncbi:MAG: hypothetical protein V2B13_10520 [Pseudomonadota bacterium]